MPPTSRRVAETGLEPAYSWLWAKWASIARHSAIIFKNYQWPYYKNCSTTTDYRKRYNEYVLEVFTFYYSLFYQPRKADFIVLAFRHSPQLRGLNIFYKTIVACLYSAFARKRRGTKIVKPFLLIIQLNKVVENALKSMALRHENCLGVPKKHCFWTKLTIFRETF